MKPSSKNPAATLREATEAQLTDELLAAQENLITLIDALPDNVIFKDAVGRWLVVNPPAVEFFQLKGVPWIGKTDAELAKEIPALKDLFAACTRSDEAGWAAGKLTHVTERGPGPDGRMQEHEVHKVPLFNPDGSRRALLIVGRDVTEKRRLEKSLKLSELMASQSRDVLLLVRNRDGQIMTANASAVEFYGYTPEELLTKTIYDLRQNNNVALAAHQLSQAFASGILFETVHVHKDGHTIPVEVSSRGVSHEGEEFLISSVRDISIRKEAKSKLLQLEQSMAAAANGIFLVKPNGKIFWANEAFTWLTGYTTAEVLGQNPSFLKSGRQNTEFYREMWHTVLNGKVWQGEIINRRKDGTFYTENKTITPVRDAAGQLSHFICVQEDITARKQVEHLLIASENKFRGLYETITDGIVSVDMSGQIREFNPAYAQMLGYSDEELLRLTYKDLTPEKWQAFEAGIVQEQVLSRGFSEVYEKEYRRKDGTVFPVELRTFTIKDEAGQVAGMWVTVRDITLRKKAETNLRTNEARLRTWFEMPLAGIAITSTEKGWIQINDRLCEMLGYERQELYGMTWAQITHPDDLAENEAKFASVVRGEADGYAMEKRFLRKNGEYLQTDLTVRSSRLADGKMDYIVALIQDITERKRAERELGIAQETASQKSALIKSILESPQNVVIFSLDTNYCYTEFTESHKATIKQIWGVDIAVGINMLDIIGDPADRAKAKANFDRALRGEAFLLVEEYGDRSHLRTYFEDRYSPIYGSNGEVAGLTVFVIDITERKRAEAAIIGARDFHLQLLENAPALIWRASTDAKCNWFNATWLAFTGRTLEQESGDGWTVGVHPDDLDDCVKRYLAHFEKREPFMLEYRLRRHDSEYRWIADYGQPFELPGGGFGGYIGYCYDIHDTRQAKELLELRVKDRTREIALLSEVIDQSSVAFSMSNPDGSFITFNEAFTRLTGYTSGEILGNKLNWNRDLTPPEWRAISAEKLEECLRNRLTVRFEKEYLRKDGSRVPVEVFVQPIYDSNGILLHLRAFITDITERKQTEAAMLQAQAKERLLADVIDTSDVAFCTGSPYGGLTMVNQAFEKLTGYSRTEVKAKDFSWIEKLTPPKWRDMESKLMEECVRLRQPVRYEKEYIHKDGHHFPVELFVQPVFDSAGEFINCRVFLSDISERKKAAEALATALQEANRANRAKSEFLAHMSHEIRTPMNIILGNTQLLQREMDLPEKAKNKITTINRSGEHLLTILNEILDLAKVESGQMEVHLEKFGLNRLLDDLNHLFHPSAQAKQLSLTLKTDDHLPEFIQGDQQKIRQVLNNLLSNAVKFTQTGGVKLTVSAQPDGANKWRLIFAVADTGPGIPPEELEHLFENFRQGEAGRQARTGTGLGLALCWKYAALLQGRIGVQSELGKGSTFQFEVPVGIASDTPLFSAKNLTEASRPPVDASALHKNNISAKLLAALPPAWGKELREALLNADADKITGLLKAIEPHDPETAKCLLTLASEFDYENILQQLDACGLWL